MSSDTIHLVYGFVFLSVAMVIGVQALCRPSRLIPLRSMLLLALATATSGANQWTVMTVEVDLGEGHPVHVDVLRAIGALFMTTSFWSFAQFGVETLIEHERAPRTARYLPAVVVAITWTLILVSGLLDHFDFRIFSVQRYMLGIAGTLTAAYALFVTSDDIPREDGREGIRTNLRGAAFALCVYAFLAGAIVRSGLFFPASVLNDSSFLRVTHVPVNVVRIACAMAIGWFLIKALVVEAAREHAAWETLREEFIAIIAHDLRNPVTAIALTAELLPIETPDEIKRRERLLRNTGVLTRLVDDLLDASRIECRHLELRKRATDLAALVRACVEQSGIERTHDLRIDVPSLPAVDADPDRITQVLTNLISNAAKYAPPSSTVVVSAAVAPRGRDDGAGEGGEVVVSVTNDGHLEPGDETRLFSRFYRTRSARRGAAPGMGLGLYITRGLVESHGGRIWVESAVATDGEPHASSHGEHITFRFSLPRHADPLGTESHVRLVA